MKPLDQLLVVIADYWQENNLPPTLRDLKQAAGCSSISVTQYRLGKLGLLGLVVSKERIARSIRLTPAGAERVAELRKDGA